MPIATNHHPNIISGDARGVACTVRSEDGNVFIVSLTHFRTEPDPHLSGRTLAYQKQTGLSKAEGDNMAGTGQFDQVYQFKITLKSAKPPIWRRIQVPETYTFWDLHVAIQDAMGWRDYHLRQEMEEYETVHN